MGQEGRPKARGSIPGAQRSPTPPQATEMPSSARAGNSDINSPKLSKKIKVSMNYPDVVVVGPPVWKWQLIALNLEN